MAENQSASEGRQSVYVDIAHHKKLKLKQALVYGATSRKCTIQQLVQWLIDNRLDDFPM